MKVILFSLLAGAALTAVGCTSPPSAPSASPAVQKSSVAPSVTASRNPQTANGWSTFTLPDGSLRVETPVPLVSKPDESAPDAIHFVGQGGEGNRTWEVGHQQIPPPLLSARPADDIAILMLKAMTFTDDKRKPQAAPVGGHPGYVATGTRADGAVIRAAVSAVDGTIYTIRVITPVDSAKKDDGKAVDRFIGSLQILAGSPASAPGSAATASGSAAPP